MSISTDIGQSWFAHRKVVRRHLARGQSEPFIFTFLFVFLLLAFVARYPGAARVAMDDPATPLAPQLLGIAMGLVVTIPFFYALAALSHVVGRALGGKSTWFGARLALFWSLVAASPLVLLQGLVAGLIGAGVQNTIVGGAALCAFLVFWALALAEINSTAGDGNAV
jgi:hypothetical protein